MAGDHKMCADPDSRKCVVDVGRAGRTLSYRGSKKSIRDKRGLVQQVFYEENIFLAKTKNVKDFFYAIGIDGRGCNGKCRINLNRGLVWNILFAEIVI